MNNKILTVLIVFLQSMLLQNMHANEPDSAYIFAYATIENNNHNGLHFA